MPKFSLKILAAIVGSALFLMGGAFVYPFVSFGAGAGIELTTTSKNIKKGDSFTVNIIVDPAGAPIDTARVGLSYPADIVTITSFREGSLYSNKSSLSGYDNNRGSFSWGEYTDGDGVTKKGLFGVLTFKALRDGVARIQSTATSHLISAGEEKIVNYGSVTVVIGGGGTGSVELQPEAVIPDAPGTTPAVTVVPSPQPTPPRLEQAPPDSQNEVTIIRATGTPDAPLITSPTHPDQTAWFVGNNPEFVVGLLSGTTGINVIADKNPRTDPGTRPDVLRKTFVYQNVANGTWYFHAKLQNNFGWGDTAHYKFQIDTEAPSDLTVERTDAEGRSATFAIQAKDATSGVDRYMISVDDEEWRPWGGAEPGTYTTASLEPGLHVIKIQVFDKAGNKKELSRSFEIVEQGMALNGITLPSMPTLASLCDNGKYWFIIIIELLWIIGELLALALMFQVFKRVLPIKKLPASILRPLSAKKSTGKTVVKKSKSKVPPKVLWG